jgi:hypothetical protein
MPPLGRYHRGSLVCPNYELRITLRCLADDLHEAQADLEGLDRHEIIRAFVNERSQQPVGVREVGRGRNARPLWRLAIGHDHRGATWHDEEARVVWLCACGRHRSGQPDDAFQHFDRLIAADIIYPTAEDYRLLEGERARRFADLAPRDAAALRAAAERQPEVEVRGRIGEEHEVGVVSVVVELVGSDLYVGFPARVYPDQLVFVLAAFEPNAEWTDWRQEAALPGRALAEGELCYSIAIFDE